MSEEFFTHLAALTDQGETREIAQNYFADFKLNHAPEMIKILADFLFQNDIEENETLFIASFIALNYVIEENAQQGYALRVVESLWESLDPSITQEVKDAALKCLLLDNIAVRNLSAHTLTLVLTLEKENFGKFLLN